MSSKKTTSKARKVAQKKPAAKTAKKAVRRKGRGVRYDEAMKKEVIDYVVNFNIQNGRGGQSAAARKFGVTILTVSSWLKGCTERSFVSPMGAAKNVALKEVLSTKVKSLLELSDRIRRAESELQKLQNEYSSLSAGIRTIL